MVRIIAPVLFVQTLAEESLMQASAHELEMLNVNGATRTSRMQASTKQMEDQYKAILDQVVNSGSWNDPKTGNPWVPNRASVLDPVDKVIGEMEDELVGQQELNTGIMNKHTQDIAACNSVRDAAVAAIVANEKKAMTDARGAHAGCRSAEDDAIISMESVCEKFAKLDKCNHEQDWFAAVKEGKSGQGTLQAAIDQAVSCKSHIAATTAKANECDGSQDSFRDAFCSYASDLTDACTTHENCYSTTTGNWDQAQGTIDKLEKEQKIIYRMLGRIRCYLKLLLRSAEGGTTPVQQDIADCQGATVTDEPLNVEYGAKADAGKCYDAAGVVDESVDNRPGSEAWYNAEFSSMTAHGKLQPNTNCP